MIPEDFIASWRKTIPWQMNEQIEQDLIISRALVDLYNDPHIKEALVFRGGTALNKLFINVLKDEICLMYGIQWIAN